MLTELINFDSKSLLGILVWGNAAAGIIVCLYHSFNVRNADRNNILNMSIVRLLCAVGYLLLFFRGNINDIISVNIGNTILFLSHYLEAKLMFELTNTSSKKLNNILMAIFVMSIFTFNVIECYNKDASLRVGIASIIIFSIFLLPTIRIITAKEITKFKRSISIFYILLLLALIPRSLEPFGDKSITVLSDNYYQTLMFIALILMAASNTIIYLLFIKERTDIVIEKNNELKTLLNALDTYMFVSELDTDKIIFINDKMKKHFRLSDDAIGKHCYDIMNSCMNERCTFCVKLRLLNNPNLAESMDTQVKVNGAYYKKADRVIEWNDGRKVHLQYFIDVSELKKAEKTLNAQLSQKQIAQDSLQTLLDVMPIGVRILDMEDETLIYANKAASKMYKVDSPDSFYGKRIDALMPEVQPDGTLSIERLHTLNMSFEPISMEMVFRKADGEDFDARISVFAIDYKGRKASVGIIEDLSEEKAYENMLRNMAEKEKEANRSKSEFLSRMSHEIRTPMNAIIGMTSIAHNSLELEKIKHCLNKIDNASKHLLGVINDILDMSKIEANKLELSLDEFSFNGMIENIMNIINFRTESKQQVLNIRIDENVPKCIIGDEQRLSQVITNLLSNASKFTPDNGTIELFVDIIEIKDNICSIQIEVKDNGIGIRLERQSNIFNSFEQADSSIAHKYGGTGLGLAISKRIVELMGGRIWVVSELGSGSRFIFTVKVMKGSGQSIEEKQSPYLPFNNDFSSYTILLAEDVEINSEIITTVLKDTGVKIDTVINGLEAVKYYKDNPDRYSLILMDINMPEMNGYEATRSIRAHENEKAKTVPIIAMTADVFKEDIERCLLAGMNDHIGKPLNMDELFVKLNKYLRQSYII